MLSCQLDKFSSIDIVADVNVLLRFIRYCNESRMCQFTLLRYSLRRSIDQSDGSTSFRKCTAVCWNIPAALLSNVLSKNIEATEDATTIPVNAQKNDFWLTILSSDVGIVSRSCFPPKNDVAILGKETKILKQASEKLKILYVVKL